MTVGLSTKTSALQRSPQQWHRRIEQRLRNHRIRFEKLLATAEKAYSQGTSHRAAVFAQMAADFAARNHTGLFASTALESLLSRIGLSELTPDSTLEPIRPARLPKSVLHVMTHAKPTGGHTRLVENWVKNDSGRRHSIVVTGQGKTELPSSLQETAAPTGGSVKAADAAPDLILQAQALRAMAVESDFVVLHVDPYDVVPLLAFAHPENLPPVVFSNHADHLFWVGRSVSNLVIHIRESARLHSVRRRGIEPTQATHLPIPLTPTERNKSVSEAKEALGLPVDSTLLLSMGWGYKYTPVDEFDFVAMHREFLLRNPQVHLLVVGPRPRGVWRTAEKQTGGRLRATGGQTDLALYREAADIYVNSFPFSSLTSLLEAGLLGVPVVSFDPFHTSAPLFGSDDAGVSAELYQFEQQADYLAQLQRFVDQPAVRRVESHTLQRAIATGHTGQSWRESVESVYEHGLCMSGERCRSSLPQSADEIGLTDLLLIHLLSRAGRVPGVQGSIVGHWRRLPVTERRWIFLSALLTGRPFSGIKLLWDYALDRLFPSRQGD